MNFLIALFMLWFGLVFASLEKSAPIAESKKPPQLWSHHKKLDISVSSCALKGYSALKSLGFTSVVQNGNDSYGSFHDNRAAVKCVSNNTGAFLYLMIAGPEKEIVEKLSNKLVGEM
ncbi:MAG: hypothetical protein V3V22_06005 [Methylococcales bacterium]